MTLPFKYGNKSALSTHACLTQVVLSVCKQEALRESFRISPKLLTSPRIFFMEIKNVRGQRSVNWSIFKGVVGTR